MKISMSLSLLFAALLCFSHAADQVLRAPGDLKVYAKITEQGGKLMLSNSEEFKDDETIVIQLASVTESGKADGSDMMMDFAKRTFNTFSDQKFTLSTIQEGVNYPNTEYKVNQINLETDIKEGTDGPVIGKMTLTVFILQDASEIDMDGEKLVTLPGTLKFNIQVDNYNFCTAGAADCEGNGEELKIEFEVMGMGGSKVEKASKRREGDSVDAYHTGGTSAMRISNKVQVDGQWQDLTTPVEFMSQDSKNILRLTLPKFQNSAMYDPSLDLNVDGIGSASVGVDGGIGVDEEGVNVGLDGAHANVNIGDNSAGASCVTISLFTAALVVNAFL